MKPIPVPEIWNEWAALATISGVVERRVWTLTDIGKVYPSIFVFLVAPPGVGKSLVLAPVRTLWAEATTVNIAPDSMTKSGMVDHMAQGKRVVNLDGLPEVYHSISVGASEFDVFMPMYDQAFLSHCCLFWDCEQRPFGERTRGHGDIQIENPYLTLIAGIQPAVMDRTFPEIAWGQGFMARCIFAYAPSSILAPIFGRAGVDPEGQILLVKKLKEMHHRLGYIPHSSEATAAINAWHTAGSNPVPTHPRLVGYNSRRTLQVIKLGLLFAISRGHEKILLGDVESAKDLLFRTEESYSDMLHAVILSDKSHGEIYHAVHTLVIRFQAKSGKACPETLVRRALMSYSSNPQLVEAFLANLQKSGVLIPVIEGSEMHYKAGSFTKDIS